MNACKNTDPRPEKDVARGRPGQAGISMVRHGVSECSLTCRSGLALSSRASFWPGVVQNGKPPCNQSNHGSPRLQAHNHTTTRPVEVAGCLPFDIGEGDELTSRSTCSLLIVSERGPMNCVLAMATRGIARRVVVAVARLELGGPVSPVHRCRKFSPSHSCGVGNLLSLLS